MGIYDGLLRVYRNLRLVHMNLRLVHMNALCFSSNTDDDDDNEDDNDDEDCLSENIAMIPQTPLSCCPHLHSGRLQETHPSL